MKQKDFPGTCKYYNCPRKSLFFQTKSYKADVIDTFVYLLERTIAPENTAVVSRLNFCGFPK